MFRCLIDRYYEGWDLCRCSSSVREVPLGERQRADNRGFEGCREEGRGKDGETKRERGRTERWRNEREERRLRSDPLYMHAALLVKGTEEVEMGACWRLVKCANETASVVSLGGRKALSAGGDGRLGSSQAD